MLTLTIYCHIWTIESSTVAKHEYDSTIKTLTAYPKQQLFLLFHNGQTEKEHIQTAENSPKRIAFYHSKLLYNK